MYNPRYIIDVLADNIRKTRNPFGAGNKTMNKWWKGADLPSQGDTMLYTGLMYQLMPYIKKPPTRSKSSKVPKWVIMSGYRSMSPNCW